MKIVLFAVPGRLLNCKEVQKIVTMNMLQIKFNFAVCRLQVISGVVRIFNAAGRPIKSLYEGHPEYQYPIAHRVYTYCR